MSILKYGRIAIIGIGKIGSILVEALSYFNYKINELLIIDYNKVEFKDIDNIIYGNYDIGEYKVNALKKIIDILDFEININPLILKFEDDKHSNFIKNYDIVIDCRNYFHDELNDIIINYKNNNYEIKFEMENPLLLYSKELYNVGIDICKILLCKDYFKKPIKKINIHYKNNEIKKTPIFNYSDVEDQYNRLILMNKRSDIKILNFFDSTIISTIPKFTVITNLDAQKQIKNIYFQINKILQINYYTYFLIFDEKNNQIMPYPNNFESISKNIIEVDCRLYPSKLIYKDKVYNIIQVPQKCICNKYKIILKNNFIEKIILIDTYHPNVEILNSSYIKYDNYINDPPYEQNFIIPDFLKKIKYTKNIKYNIEVLLQTFNYDSSILIKSKDIKYSTDLEINLDRFHFR